MVQTVPTHQARSAAEIAGAAEVAMVKAKGK
jgi:hypothetical protein